MPFVPDKPTEEAPRAGRFVPDVQEEKPSAEAPAPAQPKSAEQLRGEFGLVPNPIERAGQAIAETGLGAITGTVGQAIGGLRGIGALMAGGTSQEAAEKVRATQEALTYEPRTEAGRGMQAAIAKPFELGAQGIGTLGGIIGHVLGGEQGRIAGSSIGEAALPMAMAALPLKGIGKVRAPATSAAAEVPVAGETYSPLRQLTPEQQERYKRQQEAGVQPTLGSVTREPEQFRREEQLAKQTSTPAGKALYEREKSNQQAIIDAIKKSDENVSQRTGAQPIAVGKLQTGESLQTALHKREEQDWQTVRDKYNKAKQSGETNMVVNANPLKEWLNKNRAFEGTAPALGAIRKEVSRLEKEFGGNLTLGDMEELYKTASNLTVKGEPSSVYMPQVKKLINEITQGQGGDLYREARQARRAYAEKWENKKSVADLVGKKFGYSSDPKVAADNIFDKVMMSKTTSLQDLKHINDALMHGDLTNFKEGPQAWRDLQSHTINHLLDEAQVGTREAPRLSHAKFERLMKTIGPDKLEYLLGKDTMKELDNAVRTMEETQVQSGKVSGSPTHLNQMMQQNMGRIRDRVLEAAADHAINVLPWWVKYPAKHGVAVSKRGKEAIKKRTAEEEKQREEQALAEEALHPLKAPREDVEKLASQERAKREQIRLEESLPARKARAATAATAVAGEPARDNQIPMEEGM